MKSGIPGGAVDSGRVPGARGQHCLPLAPRRGERRGLIPPNLPGNPGVAGIPKRKQ